MSRDFGTSRTLPFFLALACALFLGGCAVKPMTMSNFYSFCIMEPLYDVNNCETQVVCGDFRQTLEGGFDTLEDCLNGCRDVVRRQNMLQALRGCESTIIRGSNYCGQYCRRAYPVDRANPAKPANPAKSTEPAKPAKPAGAGS